MRALLLLLSALLLNPVYAETTCTNVQSADDIFSCVSDAINNGNTKLRIFEREQRCEPYGVFFSGLMREKGQPFDKRRSGRSDLSGGPSCEVYAGVYKKFTGKSIYWEPCIETSDIGSAQHIKECVSSVLGFKRKPSSEFNTLDCKGFYEYYEEGLKHASIGLVGDPKLPNSYKGRDCEIVASITQSNYGGTNNWKSCLSYSPESANEHIKSCLGDKITQVRDCAKLRSAYEAKLKGAYGGNLPNNYKTVDCETIASSAEAYRVQKISEEARRYAEEKEKAKLQAEEPGGINLEIILAVALQIITVAAPIGLNIFLARRNNRSTWIWGGLGLVTSFFSTVALLIFGKYEKFIPTIDGRSPDLTTEEEMRAGEERINKKFDEKTSAVHYHFDRIIRIYEGVIKPKSNDKIYRLKFKISRNLAVMPPIERECLRALELLRNWNFITNDIYFDMVNFGLVYGDGKSTIDEIDTRMAIFNQAKVKSNTDLLKWVAEHGNYYTGPNSTVNLAHKVSVEYSIHEILSFIDSELTNGNKHPALKRIQGRVKGGNSWTTISDDSDSIFNLNSDGVLLGDNDDSETVSYSGEGSLVTIAPPGSGKTQCAVFPNLLNWKGPAVVLDIKGEIYDGTSKWRSENVGPVYKFCPLDPDNSSSYNPLYFIRGENEYIWEDSRFLAEMMVVPTKANDPFFDNKAKELLTAFVAYVCYLHPSSEDRNLSLVIDLAHRIGWDDFVSEMKGIGEIPPMRRAGYSWGEIEPKTLDGILQTLQSNLSAWDSERIMRATERSDWSPLDLRHGENPTVYICLTPSEVESYISLLRVFISQHIRLLTSELPSREEQTPILFMLDELPRLRHMKPVEEALDIGRQYGIRLWMFAQSLGQLEEAYPNAKGMVGSCAVQMYMNPSQADGTAKKISESLGYQESVIDSSRKLLVEPSELTGPDYKDKIIVLATSSKPLLLDKHFAWKDEGLSAKLGKL